MWAVQAHESVWAVQAHESMWAVRAVQAHESMWAVQALSLCELCRSYNKSKHKWLYTSYLDVRKNYDVEIMN